MQFQHFFTIFHSVLYDNRIEINTVLEALLILLEKTKHLLNTTFRKYIVIRNKGMMKDQLHKLNFFKI